jgi:signal transduction histidine kinase
MQNAGKYAGDDARIVVSVSVEPGTLVFDVADDGVGFPPGGAAEGHGFVNMRDRLGALGGELQVDSRPGATRIVGRIPIADLAPT